LFKAVKEVRAMSFDVPAFIEPDIQQYADAQHISEDQAIVQLLQAGLQYLQIQSPRAILGAFATSEESAAMDEALELAMRDRDRRNARNENA
jgi:hypothetical protein